MFLFRNNIATFPEGLHQINRYKFEVSIYNVSKVTSDVNMLTFSEGTRTLAFRISSPHTDHRPGSDHVHYVAPCSGVGSPMLLVPSVEIFYPQLSMYSQTFY